MPRSCIRWKEMQSVRDHSLSGRFLCMRMPDRKSSGEAGMILYGEPGDSMWDKIK